MAALSDRRRVRGGGPLPPERRRTHCVSVRLSPAELAQLDARRAQLDRGEWLRCAALDRLPPPPPPAINVQAWRELARLSAVLNQLAALMHATGLAPDIAETRRLLTELRAALIGARLPADEQEESR